MTYLQFSNQINPPSDTTYENCLKSYVYEVQTLKEENSKLKKQFDETVPSLQNRIDALEKLNQSLNYQNQVLESAYAKNNSNSDICEALSKKFQSKDEKIAILKAKNKELKNQNRNINSKLLSSRANEKASLDRVKELENKLSQMEEINEAMKIRLANYEESFQLKTTSVLEDEITKLKKINSQLSKKLKKFQANFSQPSIHQQDFTSINQRKTKSPTSVKSHRTKSPSQNQKSVKRRGSPNSLIYKKKQNEMFFNDLNSYSDSGSDYNTKSDSDFEINNDFNDNRSYHSNIISYNDIAQKTKKVTQKYVPSSPNRPKQETSESELAKIAELLKQNYSGFSPTMKISDQFKDFIDQISAIASKD